MLLTQEECLKCGKVTNHFNGRCGPCEAERERLQRAEHFGKLDALTLEQRVRRLEEIQYAQATEQPCVDG